MSTVGRWAVAALLTAVALIGFAGVASAHNVLTGSDPEDGAVLDSAPPSVSLTFDQPVQNFEPVIAVTGPNGNRFESGPVTVSGNTATVALSGAGPAGSYTVAYRVVSADGHPVTGEIGYALSSQAGGTVTGAPPADGTSDGDSASNGLTGWLWAGIGLAVVLVIAAVVVMLRRPSDET